MPIYNCDFCNYKTKLLGNYKQHTKTTKHRVNRGDENTELEVTPPSGQKYPKEPQKTQSYECDYCNVEFSTYATKRRHELHRCKENDALKDLKIKKLEKENKNLEQILEILLDKVRTINNTNE